ncbi:MAG: hypothetical protein GF320_01225 [Armatimonadia bacterium]|nr:hypothetical protein [Armatimonadia bacterium]
MTRRKIMTCTTIALVGGGLATLLVRNLVVGMLLGVAVGIFAGSFIGDGWGKREREP